MNNLTLRLITASVTGPLFLLGMWWCPQSRLALVAWVLLAGAGEWERLVNARYPKASAVSMPLSWISSLGFSALAIWGGSLHWFLLWGAAVLLAWTLESFRSLPIEDLFPWLAQQLMGVFFIGAWGALAFRLVAGSDSYSFAPMYPLLFVLFCMWVVDTGAYICGRLFGKHKLASVLSPKKTWEGAVGGTILTAGFGFWFGPEFLGLSAYIGALFAVVLAIFGQVGDLLESAAKRWSGIKDSSNLLPGHGGFLDRFDGFYFAAPVAALFLMAWGAL